MKHRNFFNYLLNSRSLTLLTFLFGITFTTQAQWSQVPKSNLEPDARFSDITIGDCYEYVVYVVVDIPNQKNVVWVDQSDGNTWQHLGGPVDEISFSGNSLNGNVQVEVIGGEVYVGYAQVLPGSRVTYSIKKYNGSSWEYVGAPFFTERGWFFNFTNIDDTPYLSYASREPDGNGRDGRIQILKFENNAWRYVGPRYLTPAQGYGYESILAKDGTDLFVLYRTFFGQMTVLKYTPNSNSWSSLPYHPGIFARVDRQGEMDMVAKNNAIFVTCSYRIGSQSAAQVFKYENGIWTTVGSPGSGAGYDRSNKLRIINGELYHACINYIFERVPPYNRYYIPKVQKYNGSSWQHVGATGFANDPTESYVFATDGHTPYIMGHTRDQNTYLNVTRFYRFGAGQTACCTPPDPLAEQNCNGCGEIRVDYCQHEQTSGWAQLIGSNSKHAPAATLKWYADNAGNQGAAMGSAPSINTANKGTKYYWVSQELGCEGQATRVRVRVKKKFVPIWANVPSQGCGGGNAQLNLASYVSDPAKKATRFVFYTQDPEANPAASPIGSVAAKKGVVKAGQNMIVTLNASTPTYWVQAVVPNGCGGVASTTISMPSAVPTVNHISNYSVTAGDQVNITFSGTNTTTIIWSNHSSFNNPNIGIIGALGISSLSFTAQNNGSSDLIAKIRIIPYNGSCAGTPVDFFITVHPSSATRHGQMNSLQFAARQLTLREVALNWQLVYDQELIRFEVEKEVEEGEWTKIGEVASHGNGSYGFTDPDAHTGITRYRLHLVHADGRSVWSEVVTVEAGHALTLPAAAFSCYPNPTTGRLTIRQQGETSSWQWQVTDITGRILMKGEEQGNEMSLDLSAYAPGVYQLITISEKGQRQINRIVKQ